MEDHVGELKSHIVNKKTTKSTVKRNQNKNKASQILVKQWVGHLALDLIMGREREVVGNITKAEPNNCPLQCVACDA